MNVIFLEPIDLNLCNSIDCGVGTCFVTSRNLTFCVCASGVTGTHCDQRMYILIKLLIKKNKFFFVF